MKLTFENVINFLADNADDFEQGMSSHFRDSKKLYDAFMPEYFESHLKDYSEKSYMIELEKVEFYKIKKEKKFIAKSLLEKMSLVDYGFEFSSQNIFNYPLTIGKHIGSYLSCRKSKKHPEDKKVYAYVIYFYLSLELMQLGNFDIEMPTEDMEYNPDTFCFNESKGFFSVPLGEEISDGTYKSYKKEKNFENHIFFNR